MALFLLYTECFSLCLGSQPAKAASWTSASHQSPFPCHSHHGAGGSWPWRQDSNSHLQEVGHRIVQPACWTPAADPGYLFYISISFFMSKSAHLLTHKDAGSLAQDARILFLSGILRITINYKLDKYICLTFYVLRQTNKTVQI